MLKLNGSVIFLWAELTGYVDSTLDELAKFVDSVDVVYWTNRSINSTRYEAGSRKNVNYHLRSTFSEVSLFDFLTQKRPEIIVVSGWMDKGYLKACRRYRATNSAARIVAGIDDQWSGSLRQQIGRIYYLLFLKPIFDFMWVSGPHQFMFARMFGHKPYSIIPNLYSADSRLFARHASVEKRFIYVGRLVKIKAADLLVEAYNRLPSSAQSEWPLVIIGDGELRQKIVGLANPNIKIIPFLNPEELQKELLRGGVACLPSHKDQWGVVVHEFALLGLPLLLSSGVGAAHQFLIPHFNGFLFEKGDANALTNCLLAFTKMADNELEEFGRNSVKLGGSISSELAAASLLSVLHLSPRSKLLRPIGAEQ